MHDGFCPRCQKKMDRTSAGKVSAKVCKLCGGLWLDRDLANRFSEALETREHLDISESARLVGDAVARRAKRNVNTTPGDLPCPVCSMAMHRESVERAGFDLDMCYEHGTWFDRGELTRVAHLVGARTPLGLMDKKPGTEGQPLPEEGLGSGADSDRGAGAAVALGVLGIIFEILG